jgi:hypothetical protein
MVLHCPPLCKPHVDPNGQNPLPGLGERVALFALR